MSHQWRIEGGEGYILHWHAAREKNTAIITH